MSVNSKGQIIIKNKIIVYVWKAIKPLEYVLSRTQYRCFVGLKQK